MLETEAFERSDCSGAVYDAPCPSSFVQVTTVSGNLDIIGDPLLGGGELNIEGPCAEPSCHDGGMYRLSLDGSDGLDLKAGGNVNIEAGSSFKANSNGGHIQVTAGDGINPLGGKGGNVLITAGEGTGRVEAGGNAGTGGNIALQGGHSVKSNGGDISVEGGYTSSSRAMGGSVNITSGGGDGDVPAISSGSIMLETAQTANYSGSIAISTGSADLETGSISLSTGYSNFNSAGNIDIAVGFSNDKFSSGNLTLSAGDNVGQGQGGSISLLSGASAQSTNGLISIATANVTSAESGSSSGLIDISSGTSSYGSTGAINISSGSATHGISGDIDVQAGLSKSKGVPLDDSTIGRSGSLIFAAGNTTNRHSSGGLVSLSGGHALGESDNNGAVGGAVNIQGGFTNGLNATGHVGGAIDISGGSANAAEGGSVRILSGESEKLVSGEVNFTTGDSPGSGDVSISSGASSSFKSGSILLHPGDATGGAKAGSIALVSGESDLSNGGNVTITAGKGSIGGDLIFQTGPSLASSSGNAIFASSDVDEDRGISGSVVLRSGNAHNDNSGDLDIKTGDSFSGQTGKITLAVGESSLANGTDFALSSGSTKAANGDGGSLSITGGSASNSASGSGGDVYLNGGYTHGSPENEKRETGGNVMLLGGNTVHGRGGKVTLLGGSSDFNSGGDIDIISGGSDHAETGSMTVRTKDAQPSGNSGFIDIGTGNSHSKLRSGPVQLTTGDGITGGAGHISLEVGVSNDIVGK